MASTCSVRPSCSSAPPCPTTAIAKQVTITADDRQLGRDQGVLERARGHRSARSSPGPPGESSIEPMFGAIDPSTTPRTPIATVQASSIGVCSRRLERDRVGEPGRSGRRSGSGREHAGAEVAARPERLGHGDEQRRTSRRTAAAPTSGGPTRRAAGSTSRTARASSATTRRCPPPPAARTAHPRAAPAIAAQVRALAESWQATAVRPVGDQPDPGPRGAEGQRPSTGSPPATSASAARSPTPREMQRAEARRRRPAARRARSRCRRGARPGRTPPRCGCAGARRRAAAAPRTRRRGRSSWSSRARRGCARRGWGRRARPPTGLALMAVAADTRSATVGYSDSVAAAEA